MVLGSAIYSCCLIASRSAACALASTSRRRIFSAPATASDATWSRSCSRARESSCAISASAAAFSRLPSSFAVVFASSIIWVTRFSAWETISAARSRAPRISSSACRVETSSDLRPCSAAARPSATVLCRVSIARSMYGQTNFVVNQIKAAKVMACATSVRLMFILPSRGIALAESRGERVGERKEHGDAQADDKRGVDQAKQQEHLGLKRVGELGLARRRLEEAAAHDADTDACARGAEPDHQADAEPRIGLHHGEQLKLFHCFFPFS